MGASFMRQRLERFKLPGLPRIIAERATSRITQLHKQLPPRVLGACFKLLCNMWVTDRRLRGRYAAGPCRFSCGGLGSEDSVEHYFGCRVVRRFATSVLHMRCRFTPLREHIFLTAPVCRDTQEPFWFERSALCTYAVYRVVNAARQMPIGMLRSDAEGMRALRQALCEGTRGHARAAEAACWSPWLAAPLVRALPPPEEAVAAGRPAKRRRIL